MHPGVQRLNLHLQFSPAAAVALSLGMIINGLNRSTTCAHVYVLCITSFLESIAICYATTAATPAAAAANAIATATATAVAAAPALQL